MQIFLENIVALLPEGVAYYALIILISLLESIVLIGLLVPGSTLVVLAGFLAAHSKGQLLNIYICAFAGALFGDLASYLLGSRFGARLMHSRLFQKRLGLIRKAELFFVVHGGKSIFFGRFAGPLRGSVPFVAGCTRMPPRAFAAYTLLSCVLWGIAYPALGYLGAASWQKVQQLTGRFSLLIATLLVLFIVNNLFWKKVSPRLVRRCASCYRWLKASWCSLLARPLPTAVAQRFPRLWAFAASRFSLQKGSGLYLSCGFAVSTLFAGLFFWLLNCFALTSRLDQQIYTLIAQQHHPLADRIMLLATSLANPPALIIFCGLLLLWLIINNRDFSAVILLAGMGGGQALIILAKQLFQRPRPLPFFDHLKMASTSFPSGHAFASLVLSGLLAYFLLDTLRNWRSRLTLIIGLSFVSLVIGLSRCYLGLHWFSDIVAGYLLAAIWLTFLLTVLEIRRRYTGEFPWRKDWRPLQFSKRQRYIIMTLAGGIALYLMIRYLLLQAGQL